MDRAISVHRTSWYYNLPSIVIGHLVHLIELFYTYLIVHCDHSRTWDLKTSCLERKPCEAIEFIIFLFLSQPFIVYRFSFSRNSIQCGGTWSRGMRDQSRLGSSNGTCCSQVLLRSIEITSQFQLLLYFRQISLGIRSKNDEFCTFLLFRYCTNNFSWRCGQKRCKIFGSFETNPELRINVAP